MANSFELSRRTLLAGTAVTVASSIVARSAFAQTKGGEIIYVQTSNPPSLDAMVTSSQASRNINMNIYEMLYAFSEEIKPIPVLAESLDISDDGLTYVFKLRQGVKFHNGKEMTSADVKASLERYMKVGATENLLDPVASVEATDKYTVTLKMKQATPTFLEAFCSPRAPAVIIPEEEASAEPGKTKFTGTGPYKFEEYVPDSHVTLVRFDDYAADMRGADGSDGFGGKKVAYLDKLTFRIIPESGAGDAALQAGEVHILDRVSVPAGRRMANDPNIEAYENMPWAFSVFILNMNDGPTKNPKFREAVQVAMNMEAIMAISTEGLFQLDHGWQYPGTTYNAGDIGKEWYNLHDIPRAKELLKEAGYNGEEFVLLTDSNISEHNKAAVVIAENLKEAGINVRINQVDWPTALKIRMENTGWHGWTLQMGIEPYLGPVGVIATLTGKRPHFVKNDEELDALYQELVTGKTVEDRVATFAKIQKRLYEIKGIIKVGNAGIMQAARTSVKNYKPFRFPRLYNVWLES